MQTAQAPAVAALPSIGAQWPNLGKYAGIAKGQDGQPDYHLVLLADKPAETLSWQAGLDWAKSIGADLPTRDESALLYAHLRDEFEGGWHWTSTQYSSSNAWDQGFLDGFQFNGNKKFEGRCRAVRRLPLQSFNPSTAPVTPTTPDLVPALLRQILDESKGLRTDMRTIFLADTGVEA